MFYYVKAAIIISNLFCCILYGLAFHSFSLTTRQWINDFNWIYFLTVMTVWYDSESMLKLIADRLLILRFVQIFKLVLTLSSSKINNSMIKITWNYEKSKWIPVELLINWSTRYCGVRGALTSGIKWFSKLPFPKWLNQQSHVCLVSTFDIPINQRPKWRMVSPQRITRKIKQTIFAVFVRDSLWIEATRSVDVDQIMTTNDERWSLMNMQIKECQCLQSKQTSFMAHSIGHLNAKYKKNSREIKAAKFQQKSQTQMNMNLTRETALCECRWLFVSFWNF